MLGAQYSPATLPGRKWSGRQSRHAIPLRFRGVIAFGARTFGIGADIVERAAGRDAVSVTPDPIRLKVCSPVRPFESSSRAYRRSPWTGVKAPAGGQRRSSSQPLSRVSDRSTWRSLGRRGQVRPDQLSVASDRPNPRRAPAGIPTAFGRVTSRPAGKRRAVVKAFDMRRG